MAIERNDLVFCPICLGEFSIRNSDAASNVAVLLNCSHCFHARCLESAERCLGFHKRLYSGSALIADMAQNNV